MVTYSRWNPGGGYSYYEVSGYSAPLGDDLPNPVLPTATRFGVPSVEVGHPVPRNARMAGHGDEARGVLSPMDTSRLGQTIPACGSPVNWLLAGAAIVGGIWLIVSRGKLFI